MSDESYKTIINNEAYLSEYPGTVRFKLQDHIAIITFGIPTGKKVAALSYDVFMSINTIFDKIAMDDQIWGVILTGEERCFIAGADLSDRRMQSANFNGPDTMQRVRKHLVHDSFNRVLKCERPVLAAINGHCLGGGAELASCCDFRIAKNSVIHIGYPEVELGGIPAYLGVTQLLRIMRPSYAKEMLMSAKHYNAQEAQAMGFVDYVTDDENTDFIEYCINYMKQITKNAPLAIKYCKICADRSREMPYDAASDLECLIAALLAGTEDGIEGKAARREKRKPQWKNK